LLRELPAAQDWISHALGRRQVLTAALSLCSEENDETRAWHSGWREHRESHGRQSVVPSCGEERVGGQDATRARALQPRSCSPSANDRARTITRCDSTAQRPPMANVPESSVFSLRQRGIRDRTARFALEVRPRCPCLPARGSPPAQQKKGDVRAAAEYVRLPFRTPHPHRARPSTVTASAQALTSPRPRRCPATRARPR
jgi:hypothetical protein